jgi:hypothetical protein
MKDCPPGKYYCNKEKKCMPIPRGYYVGARGWLKPDPDDDNGRKSKKNGNKNGNGHSGANGTSTSNGNGNGNGSNGGGGMSSEDWKPEIEHVKGSDLRKKAAEKKRKEAADSLPPHLRLDVMKKAFSSAKEAFEIDKTAHKSAQKKAKMRNLAKGNTNPNEKAAAEKKAGGPKLIGEGGMARQVKHSKSRSTAVLTANRGDKSGKENKARNKELGKKIRSMGYGYKKVKGEYPEKDEKTGKKKTVSEPSMAVNAPKKKFKKFKKQMKRLGKEYNQDAVITKKGKDKATLHPTTKRGRKTSTGVSRKGSKLGQVRPGKTGEYGHTKVGKKTYTYEATTLPRKNGQTMYVTFLWRGKYMSLQMFFPELKVPSKKEVQDALVKVYPGARCTGYDVVLRDPTKPILQLPEDTAPMPSNDSKTPGVENVADKLLAQKKEKQMQAKEKRLSIIKRMVLMKKIQAVRQGGGPEITA